jgi:hypothetical protein
VRIEVRPRFEESVLSSERPIRLAAAKMLRLLYTLDIHQLWSHPGLNFEKIHGLVDPESGEQVYSLRVTQSARDTACLREGPTIVLVSFHPQHDNAYRK